MSLTRRRRSLIVAAVIAVACVGGCTKYKGVPASEAAPTPVVIPTVLGPGDELEVKFYYAPELNVQQDIRNDGHISLQLVGDVQAAGLTPAQLDEALQQQYAQHLKYPEVSVIVRKMYSRRVLVTGEVLRPGTLDMPGPMSAFEAIAQTGGFARRTANVKQVIVARDVGGGKRQGYMIDMRDEIAGALTHPFMLQPTDIVIVPRTGVVELNEWLQQYISNNIPGSAVFYSRDVGDGSITLSPNAR